MTFRRSVWAGVGIGFIVAIGAIWLTDRGPASLLAENRTPATANVPKVDVDQKDLDVAQSLSRVFNAVAKKVSPAVVHIEATINAKKTAKSKSRSGMRQRHPQQMTPEEFRKFFGPMFPDMPDMPDMQPQQPQRGLGSGVIVDSNGYILTNYHVVQNADTVRVILTTGQSYEAEWVRTDKLTDLAMIKIKAKNLPTAEFGDPNAVQVGDWAMAVGNPFGLDNTVTKGIVSYVGRGLNTGDGTVYNNYIQTDAAINPGNSGGPLVNLRGEIIGINRMILTRTGEFAGIGMAIPADVAKFVADQLRTAEKVVRSYLGVQLQADDLSEPLAKSYGLTSTDGALITEVRPDTPASKGGMKADDIVLKFDGAKITTNDVLQRQVGMTPPGKKVIVTVWREGKAVDLTITMEKMPENFFSQRLTGRPGTGGETSGSYDAFGMTLEDADAEILERLGYDKNTRGVFIADVEADSEAARLGLTKGLLILKVTNTPVKTVEQFRAAVAAAKNAEGIRLYVVSPDGNRRSIFLPLSENDTAAKDGKDAKDNKKAPADESADDTGSPDDDDTSGDENDAEQ